VVSECFTRKWEQRIAVARDDTRNSSAGGIRQEEPRIERRIRDARPVQRSAPLGERLAV
jgi:hypothetical protein